MNRKIKTSAFAVLMFITFAAAASLVGCAAAPIATTPTTQPAVIVSAPAQPSPQQVADAVVTATAKYAPIAAAGVAAVPSPYSVPIAMGLTVIGMLAAAKVAQGGSVTPGNVLTAGAQLIPVATAAIPAKDQVAIGVAGKVLTAMETAASKS